jgi:hypothetical protein
MVARVRRPAATACLALLFWAFWAHPARADDIDEGEPFRSIGILGEPLAIALGRYALDLEYLPAPHHAIHLTAVGYYALPGPTDTFQGFGGEAGYRWYSGNHGPEGFFVGGSFLLGGYEYAHTTPNPSPVDLPYSTQFVSVGGAIDAGFQWIFFGNFAVGAGAGVQYTVDTTPPQFSSVNYSWQKLIYGPGVSPRVLVSIGTAF